MMDVCLNNINGRPKTDCNEARVGGWGERKRRSLRRGAMPYITSPDVANLHGRLSPYIAGTFLEKISSER